MNTMTTTPVGQDSPGTTPQRSALARNAWILAGGLALTALGLAAGLAWRPSAPSAEFAAPGSVATTKASLAGNEAVVEPSAPTAKPAEAAAPTAAPVPPAPTQHKSSTHVAKAAPGETHASNGVSTPLATQPAAVCATCGVVEGVREVTQKGQGTGLGAVAGGVLGGAVGNKMGHGNGRAAMTVLGAIGGGLAGNEIEKRARSETVYDVRVRMDDGSVRTLQQKTAPTPGTRVTVEGNTLHTRSVADSQGGQGQMMKTSSSTGT